jgi:hypothetical protein
MGARILGTAFEGGRIGDGLGRATRSGRRSRSREDHAGPGGGPVRRRYVSPHPGHAGPLAVGRHGGLRVRPGATGVHVHAGPGLRQRRPGRRGESSVPADPVGPPRAHGGAPGDRGRRGAAAAVAVLPHRHGESRRTPRDLPAPRGAARPVHHGRARDLSVRGRRAQRRDPPSPSSWWSWPRRSRCGGAGSAGSGPRRRGPTPRSPRCAGRSPLVGTPEGRREHPASMSTPSSWRMPWLEGSASTSRRSSGRSSGPTSPTGHRRNRRSGRPWQRPSGSGIGHGLLTKRVRSGS